MFGRVKPCVKMLMFWRSSRIGDIFSSPTEKFFLLSHFTFLDTLLSSQCKSSLFIDLLVFEKIKNKYVFLLKIERKFRGTGTVNNHSQVGHPKTNEEDKLNVLWAMEENSHNSLSRVSQNQDISVTHKMLKLEKWHPYKIR